MDTGDFVIETIYQQQCLYRALGKMRNDYQRLAVILYLMGYRQYEIAEVYGISKQRVQQIIAEFRQRNGMHWQGV